jgi:hypothetical protein
MAAYEVESANLEFVYGINDDKFHRIWMELDFNSTPNPVSRRQTPGEQGP